MTHELRYHAAPFANEKGAWPARGRCPQCTTPREAMECEHPWHDDGDLRQADDSIEDAKDGAK